MSKLNRNYSPLKQPSGTSRFQLNTVTSPDHIGNECNEPGNEFCVELPDKVIGTIILDREESLIFCLDNSINLINTKLCTIKKIVQLDCFNFQEDFEITGSTRIIRGCERVCYWHDHINPDRFINLTRPEKQQTDGEFDCDKFLFNSNIVHSKINREVLEFGGKLEYGTYNFAIEYLTSNEDSLFVTPIDVYYTPIIYQEEGALNISTNLPEVGGKPISNKSIRLVVENIPTDATYARIVVFRRLTSLGNTSDAHVINTLIPIQDNIFEYVYTGFNPSNGDYLVDKNEYVVPKAKYASSLNGVQVNNRYLRYNLKEDIRDYSIYQKVVNNITLKPYVKAVKPYQNQDWDTIGYQADEVYAKGIVFVYVDGTISPTFPLIGRAAFPSDLEELEVGVDIDESEVEHLGYSLGNLIPRWKVVNTGTANYIGQGSYNNLNFAYHESENGIYPTTKDCNGDFIFGSLAGQPIRHFKYPDRKTVLLYFPETDADLQNSLSPVFGFEADISTIVYPDSDIVGHYFVRGVRDNFNRTVLDSGYLMPARDPEALEENGVANPGIVISNSEYTRVENKRFYFTGTNTATSYNITLDKESRNWTFYSPKTQFKREFLNGEYFSFINNVGYQIEGNYSFLAYGVENSDYDINVRDARRSAFQPTDFTNRTYNSNIYVDSLSIQEPVQEFPTTLFNGSHSNNLNFYRFNQRIPLWTDYFDNHHNAYDFYYASNKQVADVFSNVLNISYYRAHTNILTNTEPNIVFGGDTFISIWNHVSIDAWVPGGENASAVLLSRLPIESEINVRYRHNGLDGNTYYRGGEIDTTTFPSVPYNPSNPGPTPEIEEFALYILSKVVTYTPSSGYEPLAVAYPEYYAFNDDYYKWLTYNKYNTLSLTYDFCSDCSNLYPHRIIYSPQSFPEDLSDVYRINLVNNYIDIPSHTGSIQGVDYKDNKLIVRTERGCFFITPNPQQLELSETTAYIGTGDFLSLPPQELNVTPVGYGGQQHKLDSINFEKGLVWADRERGDIYHLAGQFRELHLDLEEWIKHNFGNLHLAFSYDPYHDRMIMTQRGQWTLSYCFKEGGWKSWHSYIPDWYTYDSNTFYSIYDNKIWKHLHKSNFCNFYNLQFPHIVEMIVVRDGTTFKPQSVHWYSHTYDLTQGYEKEVDTTTYDQMLCYNDVQSSGYQTLILDSEENIYYEPTITHVKKTDRNYKASPIKDLALSNNIWTTDISSIKQGNNQGFLLLLPLIDENRPEVETGEFRNKWYAIQLIFNNPNYKISLEFLNSLDLNSKR